jgi:sigma-B regulation protein RsbU (phosphoserine phosphatase)
MNILCCTDEVTDARSPVDELFTRFRLKTIITQPLASAEELIERVKSSVFNFIDVAPHYDDVTMLALQRTGGRSL